MMAPSHFGPSIGTRVLDTQAGCPSLLPSSRGLYSDIVGIGEGGGDMGSEDAPQSWRCHVFRWRDERAKARSNNHADS